MLGIITDTEKYRISPSIKRTLFRKIWALKTGCIVKQSTTMSTKPSAKKAGNAS